MDSVLDEFSSSYVSLHYHNFVSKSISDCLGRKESLQVSIHSISREFLRFEDRDNGLWIERYFH